MWIFTKKGFLSVVKLDSPEADLLLVRGRVRKDLLEFISVVDVRRKKVGLPPMGKPITLKMSDYKWRVWATRDDLRYFMMKQIADLDYCNFKKTVHDDPVRSQAYMTCWAAMLTLQLSPSEREKRYGSVKTGGKGKARKSTASDLESLLRKRNVD